MQVDLRSRVAIVTGAARGQGAEHVRHLAGLGATVIGVDVLDDVKDVATGAGGSAVLGDVSDPALWERLTREVMADHGRLDVLVNNAAVCPFASFEETSLDSLDRTLAINVRGTFLGMQAAIAPMRASGGGSIINIASIAGARGLPTLAAYGASKWAIRGLTKVAAVELGRDGIRVNAVLPGTIDSPIAPAVDDPHRFDHLPIARIGTCDEIASIVAFLASDAAAYITGADFVVDGGATVGIPRR